MGDGEDTPQPAPREPKRVDPRLLEMLVCPVTRATLSYDAERQEFELEEEYVVSQQNAAKQLIALYKALGGGWELHQAIPPIRQPQPAIIAAARRLLAPDGGH